MAAVYNEIYAALKTLLDAELSEGVVFRDEYPVGMEAFDPYVTLSPVGGPINRIFGKSGLERFRIQCDVWVQGDAAITQAYSIYDDVTEILEYAEMAAYITGFISITRDALPIEVQSTPYTRVTGFFTCEAERSFA